MYVLYIHAYDIHARIVESEIVDTLKYGQPLYNGDSLTSQNFTVYSSNTFEPPKEGNLLTKDRRDGPKVSFAY